MTSLAKVSDSVPKSEPWVLASKHLRQRQRGRLRLAIEVHDRRIRGAGEAIVAHPDDETAAAGETVFAARAAMTSASAWRAWLHATNSSRLAGSRPNSSNEGRPLDPPTGAPPERIVGGAGHLGQVALGAADDLRWARAGHARLRAEERIVAGPILDPLRHRAGQLPGP